MLLDQNTNNDCGVIGGWWATARGYFSSARDSLLPEDTSGFTSSASFLAERCWRAYVLWLFMDFLKSAVASAIAKSGSFPYTIGDRVDNNESIWSQHNGTKKVRIVGSDDTQ